MKLLIVTQAVDRNDPILGFFHRWIEEFAKHCEKVSVICLREGEHALPQNTAVYSLGKERFARHDARFAIRLRYVWRFYRQVWALRKEYDAVFVHMNPEYVLLGGFFWRLWHKRIGLWYAHGRVTWKLRLAACFANRAFTSSPSGFRLQTRKLEVVGQGIDTERFAPGKREKSGTMRFVTVGRIAASKHLIEMLRMLDAFDAGGMPFSFTVIGDAASPEEERYALALRHEIAKRPYAHAVALPGPVVHRDLPEALCKYDVFLNFSTTGSLDKAVMEALASGMPAFSANPAYLDMLSPCGLFISSVEGKDAAAVVKNFLSGDRHQALAALRDRIIREHSLSILIPKIANAL